MGTAQFITPDAVLLGVDSHSKKHLIQDVSALAAKITKLPERAIFDTLLKRERLGSTGVGNGVAIPHGKLVELSAITGIFVRLAEPINFDALDDEPVDLVFALLAPEDAGADHLKALAKIARILRTPQMAEDLRKADTPAEVYQLLTRAPVSAAG
ncbi:MAG: PTS IIA-like nitrogen regulatory protein PtsN [Pseudomonadota bacterium]